MLLSQGLSDVFDPWVMIVTWWVGRASRETSQNEVKTRLRGGRGDKPDLNRPPPSTREKRQGVPTQDE